jgi:hypothetical protein
MVMIIFHFLSFFFFFFVLPGLHIYFLLVGEDGVDDFNERIVLGVSEVFNCVSLIDSDFVRKRL